MPASGGTKSLNSTRCSAGRPARCGACGGVHWCGPTAGDFGLSARGRLASWRRTEGARRRERVRGVVHWIWLLQALGACIRDCCCWPCSICRRRCSTRLRLWSGALGSLTLTAVASWLLTGLFLGVPKTHVVCQCPLCWGCSPGMVSQPNADVTPLALLFFFFLAAPVPMGSTSACWPMARRARARPTRWWGQRTTPGWRCAL
jgi:hypothetical protein